MTWDEMSGAAPPEAPARTRGRRLWKRILIAASAILLGLLLLALGLGFWSHNLLRGSLPALDGELVVEGLREPVTVTRDSLGIPTLLGDRRLDLARVTGFLHAQDRFFQMDLFRRRAAGELSLLFGEIALPHDGRFRIHRFRHVAEEVWSRTSGSERDLLQAYADGVNAGLKALRSKPFEYHLLRSQPRRWKPEDTILVLLSMFIELNDDDGSRESAYGILHNVFPQPLAEFLGPRGTEWDAPLLGEPISTPAIPGADVFNLRDSLRLYGDSLRVASDSSRVPPVEPPVPQPGERGAAVVDGSNSWAVAGSLTERGTPILANDMHLDLSVPSFWYRLSLVWPAADTENTLHRVTGVTLPGTPAVVVGCNGYVAWGFTNSFGDWADVIVLEMDPDDPHVYATPGGPRSLEMLEEVIEIKGAEPETLIVQQSLWGPVLGEDHQGRPKAFCWTAHFPEAVNLRLLGLEHAKTVEDAFRVAHASGIPPQNFVCCDAEGNIGWTIAGKIPRRVGFDGRLPTSWADGARYWDGWLPPEEYPRILNPPSGRIWSANNRVVDGAMLEKLGDGGFVLGARARQIRDALFSRDRFTEEDLLRIQLDDRALFYERWRDLLLSALTPAAVASDSNRAKMRRLVDETWDGHASLESSAFRLVRAFRLSVMEQVFEPFVQWASSSRVPRERSDPTQEHSDVTGERPEMIRQHPDSLANFDRIRQTEGPLWRIVTERPHHFLRPEFSSWDDQILAAVDSTLVYFLELDPVLSRHTWGERNRLQMRHPITFGAPFLGRWLDMPADSLPGAEHMPRVQTPGHGASMRLVVSPGDEEDAILHMPGGQCSHPLSPFHHAGHDAWVLGRPTPFLPGPAKHTLILKPPSETS